MTEGEDMQKVTKLALGEIKRIDARARMVEHVISSNAVDRDGEVLLPKGCQYEMYLQMNPVVFFNHGQRDLPIAKCVGIDIAGDKIMAATQFAGMEQMHERAETIFLLYRDGFLKSWSVGLQPKVVSRDMVAQGQTGRTIVEWELLEYSGVGIPSNPEAVVRMCKAAGLPDGATEDDVRKALGTQELKQWWEIALPVSGEPKAADDKPSPAKVEERKAFMGVQQHGFTTPASGASSPMHLHDYCLYIEDHDDGTVSFESGCAYGVADHSHRITLESLMRGETESSDGHVHTLMKVEDARAALLAGLTDTTKDAQPSEVKEGRVLSTANFDRLQQAHAAIGDVLKTATKPMPAAEDPVAAPEPVAAAAPDISADDLKSLFSEIREELGIK